MYLLSVYLSIGIIGPMKPNLHFLNVSTNKMVTSFAMLVVVRFFSFGNYHKSYKNVTSICGL